MYLENTTTWMRALSCGKNGKVSGVTRARARAIHSWQIWKTIVLSPSAVACLLLSPTRHLHCFRPAPCPGFFLAVNRAYLENNSFQALKARSAEAFKSDFGRPVKMRYDAIWRNIMQVDAKCLNIMKYGLRGSAKAYDAPLAYWLK